MITQTGRPASSASAATADERPRKTKPAWLERAEYLAMRGMLSALRALPLGASYRLVETLVRLTYVVSSRYRGRALASLETALGDTLSQAERRELLWRSLRFHGWFWVDVLLAPRLLLDPRYAGRVDLGELDSALREGGVLKQRGALLVGSHQGTPEIGSLAIARGGWPHSAIARPLDNRLLWRDLVEDRREFPRQEIDKAGGLRAAYRVLKRNGMVGIQIDQDAGPGGVFVSYFGRLASTHPGAATLSLLADAPVYMVFCIRTQPREFRYKVLCRGPLWPRRSGDQEADAHELTERMSAEIERVARQYPEQVLWVHRRWKTPPPRT